MAHNTWNGVPVPDAGDGILSSLEAAFAAAGVIQPAASVAAARTALTAAETAGTLPTTAHPAYFDIGGIIYRSVGAKSDAGVWALTPANEVETVTDTYQAPGGTWWSGSLSAGQRTGMISSSLPVAPYDRRVIVDASLYVSVTSGFINVQLAAQGRTRLVRCDSSDTQSYALTVSSIIRAGVSPSITLALVGAGQSGGTAKLTPSSEFNDLAVTAFPITMA